jgi:hypothetical protein
MQFNYAVYPTPTSGAYTGPILYAYINASTQDVVMPDQTTTISGTATYTIDPVTAVATPVLGPDTVHTIPGYTITADPTGDPSYLYYQALGGLSQVGYTPGSFFNTADMYILNGVITAKPTILGLCSWNKTTLTANGTDSCVLSPLSGSAGLPNPINVVIASPLVNGPKVYFTETANTFTITANSPGVYTLSFVDNYPLADYTVQITAS